MKDRIRNEDICVMLAVALIENKMRELLKMVRTCKKETCKYATVRKCYSIEVGQKVRVEFDH